MPKEYLRDIDPVETREWLDAMHAVLARDGQDRAAYLIQTLLHKANIDGVHFNRIANTPYRNSIKPEDEKQMPPDHGMADRISAMIRWNAVAMVVRAGCPL